MVTHIAEGAKESQEYKMVMVRRLKWVKRVTAQWEYDCQSKTKKESEGKERRKD